MKDQLGRTVFVDSPPQRIVCLVPSLTELLVELGLKDYVVGITKFCVHPEGLRKEKTIVGGTKSIHKDRIIHLKPDFILCNKEENTPQLVENCARIAPVYVSDIKNFQDLYDLLSDIGQIFKIENITAAFSEKLQKRRAAFQQKFLKRPKSNVAYIIWNDPVMVAGGNTFINVVLNELHFKNCFETEESRYPVIQKSDLKKVELVLLSSEPFPFKKSHISQFQKYTDAKIICVDGEYFSWYGSRLLKAFDYFEELIEVSP